MKILEVTPFFKPMWEAGGVARVAYEVSKQFSERGHEVTVYTTNRCLYPTDIVPNVPVDVDGMKVYYFENLRKYFPWANVPVIPYYLPLVAKKEIKNFDVIHIHDHRSLLAVIVCHYARKYGVPYIVQAHGSLPIRLGNRIMKRFFDLIWKDSILKYASKVIALNHTEAECYRLMGVNEDRIEVVPNGIDLSEYGTLVDPSIFRKTYGIPEDQKIVLYVGRLDPTKGIDLLIQSFSDLLVEEKNVMLLLVGGDQGYNTEFEHLIRSLMLEYHVIFTGFVSKEEKISAYNNADVFVTPSFTGFPITFLEACFCRVPIITTSKEDILDWIDGEVGYVVEYDRTKLKDAMLKILRDNELRNKLGERGQELVLKQYNWSAISKTIEKIYFRASNEDV